MYYLYRGLKVYYNIVGNGEVIVFLHGWGVSSESFQEIVEEIKNYYQVITIDFSGFGFSEEPHHPFTLNDYVDELHELLTTLNIKDFTLLAHSFGGRVAIRYCCKYHVRKLILVDSAGIKHRPIKVLYKIYRYKFLKFIYKIFDKDKLENLRSKSGSFDYQKASPILKQTMNNIIKINLKREIKKIPCKTLIFWGYYDTVTPMSDALYIHKTLANSRLIIFYHSGHFPYLDEKKKFIKAIISGGLNV